MSAAASPVYGLVYGSARGRACGLTLVEVLVTAALAALLLGLVSQFFAAQARASSLQKAQNEANEATRTALALITWDLQNAGYRVSVSATDPAIVVSSSTYKDTVTTRFFNESSAAPEKVRYAVARGAGESVTSLRRAQFADTLANPPNGLQASVASLVALNVRFETRPDQFVTPGALGCPAGSTAIPAGAVGPLIQNCGVNWVWADTPARLVRQANVQILSRSETQVPGYRSGVTYTFGGGGSFTAEPGYVYGFAEQTVLVSNLGR